MPQQTLRTRIRWRVRDTIDALRPLPMRAIDMKADQATFDTNRLEERLCTELERLLTESKIDLDSTK